MLGPIASGTFGSVYRGRLSESGESVALKRVLQDPRYKNRELRTLYALGEHENLVRLRYHYYCRGKMDPGKLYLHLVTELFPESLLDLLARYRKAETLPSMLKVRIFAYQLLRAINYMHSHRICHRAPERFSVDEIRLPPCALCDFGSAQGAVPACHAANLQKAVAPTATWPHGFFEWTYYTALEGCWRKSCRGWLVELVDHSATKRDHMLDNESQYNESSRCHRWPLNRQLSFPIGSPARVLDLLWPPARLPAWQAR
uniref:Protein kinase domain-containing protein n=1 Tax=Macrostomum lignano TaxID=282301 RepID=A0A1I8FB63_9PLAT